MLRALDLFCGAGGATKGLQRAGFFVVGVDLKPQRHYCGDHFICADALDPSFSYEFMHGFDFIWASPPCHHYSTGTRHRKNQGIVYPALIAPARERLVAARVPYCIENVPDAKRDLINPVLLCGGMFGLGVMRHRLFEANWRLIAPEHTCNGKIIDRDLVSITRHGPPARWYRNNPGKEFNIKTWHEAMGIDWMNRLPLTQAIPPAYSEFIGHQIIATLGH